MHPSKQVQIRKEIQHQQVQVLYASQHSVVLQLGDKRIVITPAIDDHSCDDVVAFLEFEEMKGTKCQ